MPNYRLQAIIKTTTGLPRDYATNTWYVTADDLTAAQAARTALAARYLTFSSYFAGNAVVVVGGLEIKIYDMAQPEPRVPLSTANFSLNPQTGDALPPEVALVLSYRADYLSGVAAASRRGRVYMPFLIESSNGTDGRPAAPIIAALAAFGTGFLADSTSATTWSWMQHSTKLDAYANVAAGFVDNEWDTQRRRGRRSTSRTNWS